MVDSTKFHVIPRTQETRAKMINLVQQDGVVAIPWKGGTCYFHKLDGEDFTITNDAVATAQRIKDIIASLFEIDIPGMFNTTLKNTKDDKLTVVGFAVVIDHKSTSPNTDAEDIDINIRLRHTLSSTARTWSAMPLWADLLELQSILVTAEDGEDEQYAGPFLSKIAPIEVKKSQQGTITIAAQVEVEQSDGGAHTVTTVYTFRAEAWVILMDDKALAAGSFYDGLTSDLVNSQ